MNFVFGLVGGVVGGALGYFAFDWLIGQGFYAMVLPGAMVGLGAGLACRQHSIALGGVSGIAALLLGFYLEWQYFGSDMALPEFIQNLHGITPVSLVMIILGGVLGFSFGKGRPGDSISQGD